MVNIWILVNLAWKKNYYTIELIFVGFFLKRFIVLEDKFMWHKIIHK